MAERTPASRLKLGSRIVVAIAFAGALIRYLIVIGVCETGWETVTSHVHHGTFGWFANGVPLEERLPSQQARFWLPTLERITKANPDSAELHMAAAMILAQFSDRCYQRNFVSKNKETGRNEYDHEAFDRAKFEYRERCRPRCMDYANKAAELEPDAGHWWQIRAILAVRSSWFDQAPAVKNWQSILAESEAHDPGNALYDYLAANQLWQQSTNYEYRDDEPVLEITDGELYRQNLESLKRGMKKPLRLPYRVAGDGVESIFGRTGISAGAREAWTSSTQWYSSAWSLVYSFANSERYRAEMLLKNERPQEAVDAHWRSIRIHEQGIRNVDSQEMASILGKYRIAWRLGEILKIKQLNPNVSLSGDASVTRTTIKKKIRSLCLDYHLRNKAVQEFHVQPDIYAIRDLVEFITTSVATRAIFVLLVCCACVAFLGFFITPNVTRSCKDASSVLIILVGAMCIGLSFFAVGLAPSEIIRRETQGWFLVIVISATVLLVAVWLGYRLLKKFRKSTAADEGSKYSRNQAIARAMLWSLVVIVPLCIMTPAYVAQRYARYGSLFDYEMQAWVHSLHVPEIQPKKSDFEVERHRLPPIRSLGGAMIQWILYRGIYVGLVGAITVLLTWQTIRILRNRTIADWRSRVGLMLRNLRLTTFVLAISLLVVYLLIAPSGVLRIDHERRERFFVVCRPAEQIDREKALIAEYRANQVIMQEIKQKADEFLEQNYSFD